MTASQLVTVVPGTIGNVPCLTVDGRALHGVLGVRRVFAAWIQGRIEKYGFAEGQDFEVFSNSGKNPDGGRPSQEYRLTVGMGKELCMVENNEHGRVARRYFIECERRLLSPQPASEPSPISKRNDPERKALTAIINTWVSMAPVHYAAARAQVNAHFGVASVDALTVAQVKEAIQWVQGKIDALPPAPAQPALPAADPLPIYRNGMYHLPPVNKRHQPGPQEAALMTLWGEWFWREGDIKRAFDALEKELDARVADLIHHAISDLGRNADTCFSADAMIEGLRCARVSARRNFDEAMSALRTHLRMSCNVAVMLGR